MQELTFSPGKLLMRENETGHAALFIKSGRVEVFRAVNGAKVRLAVLGPGSVVGEMSLVDNAPRAASVATMDQTTCILIDRPHFERLMNQSPPLVQHILRSVVRTIRSLNGWPDEGEIGSPPPAPLLSQRTSEVLRREIYRPGKVIFTEGAAGTNAYLIQGGAVEISRLDPKGNPRVLARLEAGRVFGEMALLRNTPRTATATVAEPSVCEIISRERFDALVNAAPPLIRHIINAYVDHIAGQYAL